MAASEMSMHQLLNKKKYGDSFSESRSANNSANVIQSELSLNISRKVQQAPLIHHQFVKTAKFSQEKFMKIYCKIRLK